MDSTGSVPGAIKKPDKNQSLRVFAWAIILLGLVVVPVSALFQYGEAMRSSAQVVAGSNSRPADCGVTLTGGAGRVREGVVLLSRKVVKRLIISGVNPRSSLHDIYPDIVFYPDVNLADIILERTSSSTASNAQQSLVVAEALKCQSILLITSDYHILRALKTFQVMFPPNIPISTHVVTSDRLRVDEHWYLFPKKWGAVTEEAIKFLFYRLTVF